MPVFDLSEQWKRYLVSTALTFLAGFAIVFVAELDNLSLHSFKDGAFIGAIFSGARGGLKLTLDVFINWYQNRYARQSKKTKNPRP